jgi:hypothetical protein
MPSWSAGVNGAEHHDHQSRRVDRASGAVRVRAWTRPSVGFVESGDPAWAARAVEELRSRAAVEARSRTYIYCKYLTVGVK